MKEKIYDFIDFIIEKLNTTKFEKQKLKAQKKDKIFFYDYIAYKEAAGWWTGLSNDDWHRPKEPTRAHYKSDFINNLPEYYFLGFPIKELIKRANSEGYCFGAILALSLCFDDFKICTARLINYERYFNKYSETYNPTKYKHCFLILSNNKKQYVVDTTFGFICPLNIYKAIFNPIEVKTFTSEEIKQTTPYKIIDKYKTNDVIWNYFVNSKDKRKAFWHLFDPEYCPHENPIINNYKNNLRKFSEMCLNFECPNKALKNYFNNGVYKTTNYQCFNTWFSNKKYENEPTYYKKLPAGIPYPTKNMFSLTDDKNDENILVK